jgi:hypothetical protein
MEDKEKREQLYNALAGNFQLPSTLEGQLDNESAFFKAMRERLAAVVEKLLFSNNERLMFLLYQVDIPEHRINQAFDLGETKKVSNRIAELIIERQMQKIDYRKEFFSKN